MVTLNQVLNLLNNEEDSKREVASKLLLKEFQRSPSTLDGKVLGFIVSKLNDDSEVVRKVISNFVYSYAQKYGLENIGVNLARALTNDDPYVRKVVIESFSFLGADEANLKAVLEDPKYPLGIKARVAQALAHFYDKKGYFSSLLDLLKKEPVIVKGVLYGISLDRQLKRVNDKDLIKISQQILEAKASLSPKKRVLPTKEVPKRKPQEMH